jgi:hypothetical protein
MAQMVNVKFCLIILSIFTFFLFSWHSALTARVITPLLDTSPTPLSNDVMVEYAILSQLGVFDIQALQEPNYNHPTSISGLSNRSGQTESLGLLNRTTTPEPTTSKLAAPELSKTNIPVQSELGYGYRCIPCVAGETYCRHLSTETTGFKGWACQNSNPGNIRYSTYRSDLIANFGGTRPIGSKGDFMVFSSYQTGRNGLKAYIKAINAGAHSAYPVCKDGGCSLQYFFSKYAPTSDGNNPDAYARIVANAIGVDYQNTPLGTIVATKLESMIDAIQEHEGWFADYQYTITKR